MLERSARFMYRRRRYVLATWIVLLVGVFALSGAIGGAFKTEFKLPGTESQAAFDLLQRSSFRDRQIQSQIVFAADQGVDDPRVQQEMEQLFARIEAKVPNVNVVSPYSPEGATQISKDGRIAYAQLNFADRSAEAFNEIGKQIKAWGDDIQVPGLAVEFGGNMFAKPGLNGTSEAIGLAAAMVILLVAFGSVLAMGLPIGTALFGIGTGIADRARSRATRSTCPTSRRRPSRWSASAWASTTRCSSSPATARTSRPASIPNTRPCAPSAPPGARCCSRAPP